MSEQKIEEKETLVDWKDLHMPSIWGSAFYVVAKRLRKVREKYMAEGQRGLDYMDSTIKQFLEVVAKIEQAYTPKPPRTLDDAYSYALSRSYEGTFFALLDEDNNLVKVLIVKRGKMLSTVPEYTIEDTKIKVEMSQHLLKIPELDIERNIPRRVTKIIPFASDKKKIIGYGKETVKA